jgi:hypothetical protein
MLIFALPRLFKKKKKKNQRGLQSTRKDFKLQKAVKQMYRKIKFPYYSFKGVMQ